MAEYDHWRKQLEVKIGEAVAAGVDEMLVMQVVNLAMWTAGAYVPASEHSKSSPAASGGSDG